MTGSSQTEQQTHPVCKQSQTDDLSSQSTASNIESKDELDSFHQLVQTLSDILGPSSGIDSADINPSDLVSAMETYTSDDHHWQRYAFSDPTRSYTRNLVDEGNGKSNLLILVWNPGQSSPIHDHANAHCVMKILQGDLTETLYSMPNSTSPSSIPSLPQNSSSSQQTQALSSMIVPACINKYSKNAVTYISDTIGLHKITNPSPDKTAVSLHLYTPPHASTHGFNLFNEKTGQKRHVRQAGVYSSKGVRC